MTLTLELAKQKERSPAIVQTVFLGVGLACLLLAPLFFSNTLRPAGNPAVIASLAVDRWLCVPAFRRVCLDQRKQYAQTTRTTQP